MQRLHLQAALPGTLFLLLRCPGCVVLLRAAQELLHMLAVHMQQPRRVGTGLAELQTVLLTVSHREYHKAGLLAVSWREHHQKQQQGQVAVPQACLRTLCWVMAMMAIVVVKLALLTSG